MRYSDVLRFLQTSRAGSPSRPSQRTQFGSRMINGRKRAMNPVDALLQIAMWAMLANFTAWSLGVAMGGP
jgi:hypothetical protein